MLVNSEERIAISSWGSAFQRRALNIEEKVSGQNHGERRDREGKATEVDKEGTIREMGREVGLCKS